MVFQPICSSESQEINPTIRAAQAMVHIKIKEGFGRGQIYSRSVSNPGYDGR